MEGQSDKRYIKQVTTILLVALIALVAALFLPRVFGLQPLAVLSGSMEPTYREEPDLRTGRGSRGY